MRPNQSKNMKIIMFILTKYVLLITCELKTVDTALFELAIKGISAIISKERKKLCMTAYEDKRILKQVFL